MSAAAHSTTARARPSPRAAARIARWWPLIALTLLGAVLRLATLDVQSFWFDETFSSVRVIHAGFWATMEGVSKTENTPPLWYAIAWVFARAFGHGEVALRLPAALAGVASVPVAWAIGRELAGRRAATVAAALFAVNPLFVWYSQEARAYGLYVLTIALALLCFLRAAREPTRGRIAAFALAGALALLSEYFAVFELVPMVLWLLWDKRTRVAALPAIAAFVLVGAALLPLVHAQGANNTQWIGEWPLKERVQAVARYYLTGYTGLNPGVGVGEVPKPLGRGVALLVALPILGALALGGWRMRERARPLSAALLPLGIAVFALLVPLAFALGGADFLAPRNLIGALVPLTVAIAVIAVWPGTGRAGAAIAAVIALAFLAVSIDVFVNSDLQREDWRGLSERIDAVGSPERAVTTVQRYGGANVQYYLPRLRGLYGDSSATIDEIVEIDAGPKPLHVPPSVPGFADAGYVDAHGMVAYRFLASSPRRMSRAAIAAAGHALTRRPTAVFVSAAALPARR